MTCIVGVTLDKGVWIGGDTCASDKVSKFNNIQPKVFTHSIEVDTAISGFPSYEKMLIGCSGSFRTMQVIKFSFKPPSMRYRQDALSYLINEFTDELKATFAVKGVSKKSKDVDCFNGCFLIGFRGKLYFMDEAYQILMPESQEFAIGSGADFALGSLYSTRKSGKDPHARIEEALQCAEEYNLQTQGPFDILVI